VLRMHILPILLASIVIFLDPMIDTKFIIFKSI